MPHPVLGRDPEKAKRPPRQIHRTMYRFALGQTTEASPADARNSATSLPGAFFFLPRDANTTGGRSRCTRHGCPSFPHDLGNDASEPLTEHGFYVDLSKSPDGNLKSA